MNALFVKLSEYAAHMMSNEEERISQFLEGLRDSLYSEVGPQLTSYQSYVVVVDVACRMERRAKNQEEFNNKRKRCQDKKPFNRGRNLAPTVYSGHTPTHVSAPRFQTNRQGGNFKP